MLQKQFKWPETGSGGSGVAAQVACTVAALEDNDVAQQTIHDVQAVLDVQGQTKQVQVAQAWQVWTVR